MKKILLLLSILLAFPVASKALTIDATWSYDGRSYIAYGYENESKTWDYTNENLLNSGYHLATITEQAEHNALGAALTGTRGEYWLGGSDAKSEGTWEWVTGESWSYTNWFPGEPNNLRNEDHLAVWSKFNWRWNDEGNLGNMSGFIAESVSPVPEPATMMLLGLGLLGVAGVSRRKNK